MRALGIIVLAAALVACGDSGTEPTDDTVDVSGQTYGMTSFHGSRLPLLQTTGAECQLGAGADEEHELQVASLAFTATTYTIDWWIRGRCLDEAGTPTMTWVDLSHTTTGPYTASGGTLTLSDAGSYGTWTGTLDGFTLTLTADLGTVTVWSRMN